MNRPQKRNARMGPGVSVESEVQARPDHTAFAPHGIAVVAVKSSGARVIFGVYETRAEAERVARQLIAVRCFARVERARRSDMPGKSR